MDNDANVIINAVLDLDGPWDGAIEAQLQQFLTPMKTAADQNPAMAAPILNLLRHGVGTSILRKRILLRSALADITGEPQGFDALFDDAASPAFDFDQRHTLFMHIAISLFQNRAKIAEAEVLRLEQVRLRALFEQLVGEMDAALAKSSFAAAPGPRTPGRVVILTPQVLHPPHATTVRTLEYARSLIEDFGKTPVIVESHPFPGRSPVAFVPPFSSNRNERLGPIERIDVAGRGVEYYKVQSDAFGLADVVQTCALVAALRPELVIAISCPYLAAEAVALQVPTFCQPTTAAPPIVRRARTFSWTEPTAEQSARLEGWGVKDASLFHMAPGFSAPDEFPALSRAELGLPEDGFVFAVVGNRLHDDVDARFLDLLEAIAEDPRAHVAMMGQYDGFADALALRPRLSGRVSFLGFRKDILSALRVCDACLNPDRAGGGRSGVYAQYAGLPVIALPRGDVAAAVGPESCVEDYAEMAAEAGRLMHDPERLRERSEAARANAALHIGVRGLVERILREMSVAP